MRQWALRPGAVGLRTLADTEVKETTGGPYRVLVSPESVAEGFEVLTAIDEQVALQITSTSWQPHVVLLDLTPSNVDGLWVCERILATDRRVVILVLSDSSQCNEVRSLEASADNYVAKPFSPEMLLAHNARTPACRTAGNQRILELGDLMLDAKNYATWVKGAWIELRPQGFRLLATLAKSFGYL
jgi:DNA-binding response OmpR family regulator